jgi:hypothetical protein
LVYLSRTAWTSYSGPAVGFSRFWKKVEAEVLGWCNVSARAATGLTGADVAQGGSKADRQGFLEVARSRPSGTAKSVPPAASPFLAR